MDKPILVINAGSSSIKFSVFDARSGALKRVLTGKFDGLATNVHLSVKDGEGQVLKDNNGPDGVALDHAQAMLELFGFLPALLGGRSLGAVGHRVVHGGERYLAPVRVDHAVLAELEKLVPLAPLHEPHNLAPIATLLANAPDLPQIACFDTAFHRTQASVEQAFALPKSLSELGIRRYGFHGVSYEYIASVMRERDAVLAGRVIVLHLGNGASMCAMRGGQSVATTMGFTALDGLVMGTRCGTLDPGVVLYLISQLQMEPAHVQRLLYEQSGLLGVSGVSSDMRTLEASDVPAAAEAIDLFVHRISRELGALAATLGGLDGLVFTAGIGENSALIRQRVCREAAWLGVEIDSAANRAGAGRITSANSAVAAWVIPTDEEVVIARHTSSMLDPHCASRER